MIPVTISRTNDPFKKYWWVILVGFGAVGAWICLPEMDALSSGGAGGERGFRSSGAQSLDSVNNPNGAPGGVVDLSMDGAGHYRKNDGAIASSLYQAPADEAASSSSTAAAQAGSGGSFADALKSVAAKTARAASADVSGWGGEKPQSGFVAPKANFTPFAVGGGGSGSAGASFSAAPAEGGLTAFGTGKARTGVTLTRGLGGGVGEDAQMKNATASMRSLGAAANSAIAAAGQKSNDLASAMGGRSFDGSGSGFTRGGRGAAVGDASGAVALGGVGYGRLDAAPKNLKANDPKIDQKTVTPPLATPTPPKQPSMQEMMMQMMMTGLIGAVMQGIVGAFL